MIEALKTDGAVNSMFSQLSARYPELVAPLIAERDLYLAWSLKRSKAVNGAACVVGVVGKGHLKVRLGAGGLGGERVLVLLRAIVIKRTVLHAPHNACQHKDSASSPSTQGVVYALRHDSGTLRFADLVGGKNRRSVRRREQIQRLATDLVIGGVAYAAWLQLTGSGWW